MTGYYDELGRSDDPARVDGWRNRLEQWLRFEVLRRGLDIGEGASVVDLGCGTGRLCGYLGGGDSVQYVGVDLREDAIEWGRRDFPDATFVIGGYGDGQVDGLGPYDFAVAVGALVGGDGASGRLRRLETLVDRLDELGQQGWGLCVLDQDELREDVVRSLEPALQGATRGELDQVSRTRGLEVVIDADSWAGELFCMAVRGEQREVVARRLEGDVAHRRVLQRAEAQGGEIDDVQRGLFWLRAGRVERAKEIADAISAGTVGASLLRGRLGL